MSGEKRSILEQVSGEMAESKRKAVKASLKGKLEDLEKAKAAVDAIVDDIAEVLESVGEDPDEVRKMLG